MSGDSTEKVYWLPGSIKGKAYEKSTWYRCSGIEDFVKRVEQEKVIVGIVFSGNNLGFIVDEKS